MRIRGGLNILFQLNVTIGILFANLVNYGTNKIQLWGWRLSLGLAGIPALLLTICSLLVVDTPNSLIERGHLNEGKAVLKQIRGTHDEELEFNEILEASRIAQQRRDVLHPVLFNTLGFRKRQHHYTFVITGIVNMLSTAVSIYCVDRVGRRALLLEGGVQMFISQVIIAVIFSIKVMDHSDNLSHGYAILVVVMVCTFVSSFAWSWGSLSWLIPSETFPLDVRSAGQSIAVCVNLLFTFIIAQVFLSMLCHLKYAIFVFFSAWVVVMSLIMLFFLPETKNIPVEEMTNRVWKNHWYWKRYMDDDETIGLLSF
ncbi:hypothetical protein J5N97_017198 [Dioscorea zingiberensis]|uniref:Major facilitator superfamily (MFS) profile domain-containing protein n=1 Tax=Dioscorea zingiberensis TaxID=325984 RepID=A0A9D5CMT7_9LILI|nr:hypothetical protein J5N97_017198 [Dioscorea zingiberensis]